MFRTETELTTPLLLENKITINEVKNESKDGSQKNILELITDLDQDEICPISLTAPLIPIKSIDEHLKQNFELGKLMHWLDSHQSHPITRERLALRELGDKFKINKDLIRKLDQKLQQHNCTREDILDYYKISSALYDYLINFRFTSKKGRFENIKKWLRDYKTEVMLSSGMILFTFFVLVYGRSYLRHICEGSIKLNDYYYEMFLNTFKLNIYRESNFTHFRKYSAICYQAALNPDLLYATPFSKCADLFSILLNVESVPRGLNSGIRYFPHDPSSTMDNTLRLTTLASTTISLIHARHSIKKCFEPSRPCNKRWNNLLYLFMIILLVVGLDAITNSLGLFGYLQEIPSIRYSCATACNDGFFEKIVDNTNQTYEFELPKENPNCDSGFNLATAGCTLLLTPVTFFGSKLVQACRRKFKTNPGEQEFKDLAENKRYDYLA